MVGQRRTSSRLTPYEQETIINFNRGEDTAYIFTYEKTWQRHLEQKLGLKPVMDNSYGGKEYVLPKSRVRMPQAKRQYSKERKKEMADRLAKARQQQQPELL